MHNSIHVSMFAYIIYVCMHVHMYAGKNPYVCMYVCRQTYMSLHLYVYQNKYVGEHAWLCIYVCMNLCTCVNVSKLVYMHVFRQTVM